MIGRGLFLLSIHVKNDGKLTSKTTRPEPVSKQIRTCVRYSLLIECALL